MEKRHGVQNRLKGLLNNYWGERVLTQILYLEEMKLAESINSSALLDELTQTLERRYEEDGAITKATALAIEERMKPFSAEAKKITVSCTAHAHIDMNWMWAFDETVSATISTFRTMLDLLREYKDFTFSQSQASVYKIIEDYAPEMLPEIRERIKEKRWEVTASTWVEPDKNMTSGESQIRHILYTRKYLKALLGLTDDMFKIDFEPDTFGHNLNVPEILSSGGVKYYYHCRGFDGPHLYRWRSPSGKEIKVFREPTWYNDAIGTNTFLYIPSFCKKNKLDRMIHVYGVGNHGGGATRRDIERIVDYNSWPCMPTLKFGRYIDFFEYMDTLELPVVEQELNFLFNGCYTSQSRIKKANRISEAMLFEAEALNAVSHLCGAYDYNSKAFESAWENVLFNHFHDILPGSGVIDTREYALGLFQQTMAHAGSRKSAAVKGIGAQINTALMLPGNEVLKHSTSEGAGVGFGADKFIYTASNSVGGMKRLFNLYNPTQTAKNTPSLITVWDWQGDMGKIKISGENGEQVEAEVLDKKPVLYWGHHYFRVLVMCGIEPFGYRTILLEEAPVFVPYVPNNWEHIDKKTEYILENDFAKAVFDVRDARLLSFTDKETGREYIDASKGGLFRFIEEDPSKGMTSWRVGRYMNVTDVSGNIKITDVSGSLKQKLSFTAEINNSKLDVTISLDKNSRVLEYNATCVWREFGSFDKTIPQLSFIAPLSFSCSEYLHDTAFNIAHREPMDYDVPALSFAFAPRDKDDGLMLISRDKYGYRCFDNSISLTLIRSSCDPDGIPECYKHDFSFGIGIVNDKTPKHLFETSLDFLHPAITSPAASQTGTLPLSGSFIGIKSGQAVISSVKMAESDNSLIIRAFETSGKDNEVVFELFKPVKSAAYIDSNEQVLSTSQPAVNGKTITTFLKAYAVTAVKIDFE